MKAKKITVLCLTLLLIVTLGTITVFANNQKKDSEPVKANALNDKLVNYIETHNDVLSQSYGGSYIDDDGRLNIMLTGNQQECNKILLDVFAYDNPCTEIVKYSYKQIMAEKDKIELALASGNSKDNDIASPSLVDSVKMVAYDDMNNRIVVSLADTADFEKQINTFKSQISDSEMITFEATNNKTETVDLKG